MRRGVNPEKLKDKKLTYWEHRVLIPVYIPNLEETYYQESFEVFKISMHSLLKTIDTKQTAITIINNNCMQQVGDFIEELLGNNSIQKHIKYNENVGKIYPVLSEVKAVFEEYITVADADVLYMNNWVSETAKIFNNYKKAVMVSPLPCPFSFSYINNSFLFENFFRLKKGKIVNDDSFNLFMKGVNPVATFFNGKKWDWKEKQYYIEKNNLKTCVGALHFIATYKTEYLRNIPFNRPIDVFNNGDEIKFIEKHLDRLGGYRLSTIDTHAYHIGNTIDEWAMLYKFKKQLKISFRGCYVFEDTRPVKYLIKALVVKIYQRVFRFKN